MSVSSLTAVTLAPATSEPELSLTAPTIPPVVSWLKAGTTSRQREAKTQNWNEKKLRDMASPLSCEFKLRYGGLYSKVNGKAIVNRKTSLAAAIILLPAAALVPLLLAQGMGGGAKAVTRGSAKARIDLPSPKVEFRDIAAAAGLTAPNVYGGVTTKKYILEMTGNGAAIFDFDNDGNPDIFLVNGARLEPTAAGRKATSRLYHNE